MGILTQQKVPRRPTANQSNKATSGLTPEVSCLIHRQQREGKPIGLQISAAPFAETTMLALAHAYEQATEWHTMRPSIKSA